VWRLYDKQNLPTKGIESKGVVQAMTFLTTNKKSLYGEEIPNQILATGKDVIVIGGGDTGSDCVGTSNRQEPNQLPTEIMPKPPVGRSETTPWPYWPLQLKNILFTSGRL
jgi:glutamate synthase (NADPH/NADH) small chain